MWCRASGVAASGSLRTVLELVLILRDEGDADALVSRLLQNHEAEERHRLLLADRDARGRAVDGPRELSASFDLGDFGQGGVNWNIAVDAPLAPSRGTPVE